MYIEKINEITLKMPTISKLSRLSKYHRRTLSEDLSKKLESEKDKLQNLKETVIATNIIEGIKTKTKSDSYKILEKKDSELDPNDKVECAIIGTLKLHQLINDNFSGINITTSNIASLHKVLMERVSSTHAGKITGSKKIVETKEGQEKIIHHGSDSIVVNEHLDNLCFHYNKLAGDDSVDKIILSILFVSEFLAIHPFNDGNGRLARALFSLLLLKNEFNFSIYTSIDSEINNQIKEYYQALQFRSNDWNEKIYSINSNIPFIEYMINIIDTCLGGINNKVIKIINSEGINKNDEVIKIINNIDGEFTRSMLLDKISFSISNEYLSVLLKTLTDKNILIRSGVGKGTRYIKK